MEKWRRSEMKQLIGKRCKLTILDPLHNKPLYYTAKQVTGVTETHIFFIDKFGNKMAFRLIDILQIDIL